MNKFWTVGVAVLGVVGCGGVANPAGNIEVKNSATLEDLSNDFLTCMTTDCTAWNADTGSSVVSPQCRVIGYNTYDDAFCGNDGTQQATTAAALCASARNTPPINCQELEEGAYDVFKFDPHPQ